MQDIKNDPLSAMLAGLIANDFISNMGNKEKKENRTEATHEDARKIAEEAKMMFDAFIRVGFDRQQAFDLLKIIMAC